MSFFDRVLQEIQKIVESEGNLQGIYTLLQKNLGELNDDLADELRTWAKDILSKTQSKNKEEIAQFIALFSHLILHFPLGSKASNTEIAIAGYKVLHSVYTREAFPKEWAWIQHSLGCAYNCRTRGETAENVELAIKAFKLALEVRTREADREQWAETQTNLGITYCYRIRGEKADNLNKAIEIFNLALQVYTEAYKAFADAIDIAESLRDDIISGSGIEADKRKLAEEWNPYYQNIVEVCLELAQEQPQEQPQYFARAIEYAEQSKARNLVELLDNKNLYPKKDKYLNEKEYKQHCKELDDLRRKISSEQRQKESQERLKQFLQESNKPIEEIDKTIQNIDKQLEDLRQDRDKLLEEINNIDSNFKFTQRFNRICFSEIQTLLKKDTAIVEWYITNSKIITFIVTHNQERESKQPPPFWISSSEDLKELINWCKKYFEAYYAPRIEKGDENKLKEQWKIGLTTRFEKLAEILHIKEILSRIPETCNRLILVPHRFLHLLPLHALPLLEKPNKYLLDKFEGGVGYAPSCQLLQLSQKLQRNDFNNLFAVKNPKNALDDLRYAELEVDTIRSFFSSFEVLEKQNAREDTLKKKQNLASSHCCHFSCHGEFNLKSPLESALLLAEYKENQYLAGDKKEEDGRLTLAEIFGLTLDQCRLVTLSACETGMIDPDSISDEYIGLPSGFLFAGSPSVVASLWTAHDISTTLLMIKFYENLIEHRKKFPQLEEGAVAIALNQAQLWLRDLTKVKLQEWINKSLPPTYQMYPLKYFLPQAQDNEQPFREPYHWAAFCAIGQ